TLAAAVQAHPSPSTTLNGRLRRDSPSYPHLIVWYGERTGSYWVASSTGLAEVPDPQTLNRLLIPVPACC
ncbi:hypothetical protein ACWFMI_27460, partial [Nocardiopsis terrae]